MTVSMKDISVLESPQTLAVGETRAYIIDFVDVGTPTVINSVAALKSTGESAAAMLSGAASISGTQVTLQLFTPTAEDHYLLYVDVTILGQKKFGAVYVAVSATSHALTTPGTSAYGTTAGVSMLVPRYANKSGAFDDTTRPRHNDIVTLINQVSSVLNAQLAQNGFTVPITDADVTPMLALFVNEEVASIVEGINGMGRFAPRTRSGGGSRFRLITEDVATFIEANSIGIAGLGAARPDVLAAGIGYRDTDVAGDETFPLFQRKSYGDNDFQKDWDAD